MAGYALTQTEAKEILKRGEWGVLCTAAQNMPYGVPVNYVYSEPENAIYFHCALKGRKLTNILKNTNVSFTVVTKNQIIPEQFSTEYECAIAFGRASFIEDETEKVKRLIDLCIALAPGETASREEMIQKHIASTLIVRIDIRDLSGKRSRN